MEKHVGFCIKWTSVVGFCAISFLIANAVQAGEDIAYRSTQFQEKNNLDYINEAVNTLTNGELMRSFKSGKCVPRKDIRTTAHGPCKKSAACFSNKMNYIELQDAGQEAMYVSVKVTEKDLFSSDLSNSSSLRYKQLSQVVEQKIDSFFKNAISSSSFVSAKVVQFRKGSIIADVKLLEFADKKEHDEYMIRKKREVDASSGNEVYDNQSSTQSQATTVVCSKSPTTCTATSSSYGGAMINTTPLPIQSSVEPSAPKFSLTPPSAESKIFFTNQLSFDTPTTHFSSSTNESKGNFTVYTNSPSSTIEMRVSPTSHSSPNSTYIQPTSTKKMMSKFTTNETYYLNNHSSFKLKSASNYPSHGETSGTILSAITATSTKTSPANFVSYSESITASSSFFAFLSSSVTHSNFELNGELSNHPFSSDTNSATANQMMITTIQTINQNSSSSTSPNNFPISQSSPAKITSSENLLNYSSMPRSAIILPQYGSIHSTRSLPTLTFESPTSNFLNLSSTTIDVNFLTKAITTSIESTSVSRNLKSTATWITSSSFTENINVTQAAEGTFITTTNSHTLSSSNSASNLEPFSTLYEENLFVFSSSSMKVSGTLTSSSSRVTLHPSSNLSSAKMTYSQSFTSSFNGAYTSSTLESKQIWSSSGFSSMSANSTSTVVEDMPYTTASSIYLNSEAVNHRQKISAHTINSTEYGRSAMSTNIPSTYGKPTAISSRLSSTQHFKSSKTMQSAKPASNLSTILSTSNALLSLQSTNVVTNITTFLAASGVFPTLSTNSTIFQTPSIKSITKQIAAVLMISTSMLRTSTMVYEAKNSSMIQGASSTFSEVTNTPSSVVSNGFAEFLTSVTTINRAITPTVHPISTFLTNYSAASSASLGYVQSTVVQSPPAPPSTFLTSKPFSSVSCVQPSGMNASIMNSSLKARTVTSVFTKAVALNLTQNTPSLNASVSVIFFNTTQRIAISSESIYSSSVSSDSTNILFVPRTSTMRISSSRIPSTSTVISPTITLFANLTLPTGSTMSSSQAFELAINSSSPIPSREIREGNLTSIVTTALRNTIKISTRLIQSTTSSPITIISKVPIASSKRIVACNVTIVNRQYTIQLSNSSSKEFIETSNEVETSLTSIFKSTSGFLNVEVLGFRNGSVVANFHVVLGSVSNITAQELGNVIRAGNGTNTHRLIFSRVTVEELCTSGFCSNHGACTKISNFQLQCSCNTGYTGPRCNAKVTISSPDDDDFEEYWIAIGVCIGLFVLIIILLILLALKRRRKYYVTRESVMSIGRTSGDVFFNPAYGHSQEYLTDDKSSNVIPLEVVYENNSSSSFKKDPYHESEFISSKSKDEEEEEDIYKTQLLLFLKRNNLLKNSSEDPT